MLKEGCGGLGHILPTLFNTQKYMHATVARHGSQTYLPIHVLIVILAVRDRMIQPIAGFCQWDPSATSMRQEALVRWHRPFDLGKSCQQAALTKKFWVVALLAQMVPIAVAKFFGQVLECWDQLAGEERIQHLQSGLCSLYIRKDEECVPGLTFKLRRHS